MPARWNRSEVLEALLTGIENGRGWDWAPQLSDNEISSVDHVGRRDTPVLVLAFANGQQFEVRCKMTRSHAQAVS